MACCLVVGGAILLVCVYVGYCSCEEGTTREVTRRCVCVQMPFVVGAYLAILLPQRYHTIIITGVFGLATLFWLGR